MHSLNYIFLSPSLVIIICFTVFETLLGTIIIITLLLCLRTAKHPHTHDFLGKMMIYVEFIDLMH